MGGVGGSWGIFLSSLHRTVVLPPNCHCRGKRLRLGGDMLDRVLAKGQSEKEHNWELGL